MGTMHKSLTYEAFLEDNVVCSGLAENQGAKEVFEILSKEENIIAMIEYSDQNRPALAACVKEIEEWHDKKAVNDFPFPAKGTSVNENFNKTAVGRMIKSILKPFGYVPGKRMAIASQYKSKYFSSAMQYKIEKDATPQLAVKKMIVKVEKENF